MKPTSTFVLLGTAIVMFGCAERSFVRSDPPVTTNGVTVGLVGQKCEREGWNEGYDVLDLEVVVRVTNQTPMAVSVVPSEMRLLAAGNSQTLRSSAPKWEDAPIQVPPKSAADVRVHFYRRGNARCDQVLRLSPEKSVQKGSQIVALPALSFVPSPNDA